MTMLKGLAVMGLHGGRRNPTGAQALYGMRREGHGAPHALRQDGRGRGRHVDRLAGRRRQDRQGIGMERERVQGAAGVEIKTMPRQPLRAVGGGH